MNKYDENNEDANLRNVFLSTSKSIDEDTNKAKIIIREEGFDPDTLQKEGLSFIKNLQEKLKVKESASNIGSLQNEVNVLIKKLISVGLSKSFIEKRIFNSVFTGSESNFNRDTVTKYVSSIFGWTQQEIWGKDALQIVNSPASSALFKAPNNANISQIKAYSHYAYYLAKLVATNYNPSIVEKIPEDINELKRNYLKKYKQFELGFLINYIWDLGFCVLPLDDPGVFHGACWSINGKRVIVLKQKTKYHARWIFDLLHELYHALAHLDEPNSSVIELQDLNPFIDNNSEEEREANTFAHQLLFDDRTHSILNQCVKLAQGRMENLKTAVVTVSRKENIREDILANFVAFRLSLEGKNWWGPASALQSTIPDPFTVATKILVERVSMDNINSMDYSLLQAALTKNEL